MADLLEVREIIQGKSQNFTQQYVPAIDSAIKAVWAYIAEMYDLWFLRSADPIAVTLTADEPTFKVKGDRIGRVLEIQNSAHAPVWKYKDRQSYAKYRQGMSQDTTGTPYIFTDFGVAARNRRQFILYPTPQNSETYYLHFNQQATIANINLLPHGWVLCLVHGVMSLLAPPEERKRTLEGISWWKAVTADEDKLFQKHLARLVQQAKGIAPSIQDALRDEHLTSLMQEINQL